MKIPGSSLQENKHINSSPRPEESLYTADTAARMTGDAGILNVGEITERTGEAIVNGFSALALGYRGLRRFFTLTELTATQEKLDRLETHNAAILSAPKGARIIRGFGTPAENPNPTNPGVDPDVIPITWTERWTALHRENQEKKVRIAKVGKHELGQAYGKPMPASPDIPSALAKPKKPTGRDSQRWEASRAKVDAKDRGKSFAAKPRARAKPKHIKAAEEARSHHHHYDHVIHKYTKRLDKGADGRTLPGVIRRRKIQRVRRRVDKLQSKL